MSRDSKMCAAQFAKGMGIGLGVGMAVGAAAGLMMQPQKKRANGIVADAVLEGRQGEQTEEAAQETAE